MARRRPKESLYACATTVASRLFRSLSYKEASVHRAIRMFSFVLAIQVVAVLSPRTAAEPDGTTYLAHHYNIRYQYDEAGRIVQSRITSLAQALNWRVEYIYAPVLVEARVYREGGPAVRQYQYVRDASGKLTRKVLSSTTGTAIGSVDLRYGTNGRIVEVAINAPVDLPSWDPLVDK